MSICAINFGNKRVDLNSKEFWREYPDLAPRNVYLREGLVVTMKAVKKTLKKMGQTILV